jgi:hypothetical protein
MGAADKRLPLCDPVEAAGIVLFPSKLFRPGAKGAILGLCLPCCWLVSPHFTCPRLTRLVLRLVSCSLWSFCANVSSPAACLSTSCSAPFQYRLPSDACLPSILLTCTPHTVELADVETRDIANEPCLMTCRVRWHSQRVVG